jgi:hypothetical protein
MDRHLANSDRKIHIFFACHMHYPAQGTNGRKAGLSPGTCTRVDLYQCAARQQE